MSTTTDNGWSKDWPVVTGYYWRRINKHDLPSLVRIVGDTCRFTDGSSEGRYECYEFLGPLQPEQFEQLAALRKAAKDVDEALQLIQGFDFALDSSAHGQEIRKRAITAIVALREAMKGEK